MKKMSKQDVLLSRFNTSCFDIQVSSQFGGSVSTGSWGCSG